ncbi:MAG: hypothetical protein ACI31G_04620 [Bacilli bacterium]
MHKNPGIFKEEEFVFKLNNKKFKELTNNFKNMINEIFGVVDDNQLIECSLHPGFQKPDVKIKCADREVYVSIKSGRATEIHEESVKDFVLFLKAEGISRESIKTVLFYIYGDGSYDGSGKRRYEYNELRMMLRTRIKLLNIELNKSKDFVKKVIEKYLFKGSRKEFIEADYIYFGNADYGVICNKKQIFKHIDVKNWSFMSNPHIGPLQFRPHARYINKPVKNEKYRHIVDIWWANLFEDLDYISSRYNG